MLTAQQIALKRAYNKINNRIKVLRQLAPSLDMALSAEIEHNHFKNGLITEVCGKIAYVVFEDKTRLIDINYCYNNGIIKSKDKSFNRMLFRFNRHSYFLEKLMIERAKLRILIHRDNKLVYYETVFDELFDRYKHEESRNYGYLYL